MFVRAASPVCSDMVVSTNARDWLKRPKWPIMCWWGR